MNGFTSCSYAPNQTPTWRDRKQSLILISGDKLTLWVAIPDPTANINKQINFPTSLSTSAPKATITEHQKFLILMKSMKGAPLPRQEPLCKPENVLYQEHVI